MIRDTDTHHNTTESSGTERNASPRVVLHVDLDAFFVQVERSLNPTLVGGFDTQHATTTQLTDPWITPRLQGYYSSVLRLPSTILVLADVEDCIFVGNTVQVVVGACFDVATNPPQLHFLKCIAEGPCLSYRHVYRRSRGLAAPNR